MREQKEVVQDIIEDVPEKTIQDVENADSVLDSQNQQKQNGQDQGKFGQGLALVFGFHLLIPPCHRAHAETDSRHWKRKKKGANCRAWDADCDVSPSR